MSGHAGVAPAAEGLRVEIAASPFTEIDAHVAAVNHYSWFGGVYDEPGAAFVSLHAPGGRLQGCIGTLEAHQSIVEDVAHNARAAAFHDPRGSHLLLDDVDDTRIAT